MAGLFAYGAGAGVVRRLADPVRGSSRLHLRCGQENRAPGEDERTGKALRRPL